MKKERYIGYILILLPVVSILSASIVFAESFQLTAETDKLSYTPGETLSVRGKGNPKAVLSLPVKVTSVKILDVNGNPLNQIKAGVQVLVSTSLKNLGLKDQSLTYIVQVKDLGGNVVYIGFIGGTIPLNKTFTFGVLWKPKTPGEYRVEIYLWRSLKNPEPLLTFKPNARRSTKKAMREGVEVKISDDFEKFYKILEHNLGMRHNVQPTHTLEELKRLKRLLLDKIILFAAYLDNLMLGGIVLFVANPNVILAFYISHNNRYQQYRPVNLLLYEIIKWARLQGFKYLDLGTFTLNMEPNWGLGRFKENHNARGFLRDTYTIEL